MIYVALVHYPVLNRMGETITSAVTNLDIHDIARVAATYGLAGYFIVTPLQEQQELVRALTGHWLHGASSNLDRKTALSLVRITASLEDTCLQIEGDTGKIPFVVATSARPRERSIGWGRLRNEVAAAEEDSEKPPVLLVFGTASGLADAVFGLASVTLEPIEPHRTYNHLSVRSAVAIALDRLLGTWD